VKALQLGGSWRATFVALGAQLALLTGAWLAPLATLWLLGGAGQAYALPLFALGWLLLSVGTVVWARQVEIAPSKRTMTVTLTELGIVVCVAGGAIGALVYSLANHVCASGLWGLVAVVVYYALGLSARFGGRWMPFLFLLAVLTASIVSIGLDQAVGTHCELGF